MLICFLTYRMKKWKNVCFFGIRVEIEKDFPYVKQKNYKSRYKNSNKKLNNILNQNGISSEFSAFFAFANPIRNKPIVDTELNISLA